jgi:UDP-N-acetylmuramyl pentapeptide phosphotransferase/UDP-N-acetylglucosamine-1-phosphate transferase
MFRFLISTLCTALLTPFYLQWGRQQAEAQIDQMQQEAFNTPGMGAPVPPIVLLGGSAFIGGHFLVGKQLLQLKSWQAWFTLLLGMGLGVLLFWQQHKGGE